MDENQDFNSTDDDLLLRQKAILAQLLRPPVTNSLGNTGAYLGSMFERSQAQRDLPKIEAEQRRRDLASQAAMAAALRKEDPDLADMYQSGNKDIKKMVSGEYAKRSSQKRSQAEIDSIMGGGSPQPTEAPGLHELSGSSVLPMSTGRGPTGGNTPSLQQIERMLLSADPTIKARGEQLYKLYGAPHAPSSSVRMTRGGGYAEVPGADEAYQRQQAIRNQARAETTPGREELTANGPAPIRSQADQLRTPSVLPGAIGAMPPSAPAPVTPPSALPGATGAVPGLPPPNKVIADIRAADAARGGKPYTGTVAPNGQMQIQDVAPPQPEIPKLTSTMRMTPEMQKQFREDQKAFDGVFDTLQTIDRMEKINQAGGMSRGGAHSIFNKGLDWAASMSPSYTGETMAATQDRRFDSQTNNIALNMVTLMKGNLSDKDVQFLKDTATGSWDNPAARAAVLQQMKQIAVQHAQQLKQRWNPSEPTPQQQPGAVGKQSAAGFPEDHPMWSMQAGTGEIVPTSALPGSTAALAKQRSLVGDVKQGASDLWGQIKEGGHQGLVEAGMGAAQFPGVADLAGVPKPSYEDVKRLRREMPALEGPGQFAKTVTEVGLDPTIVGGGGILAHGAKGVLSGALRAAGSGDDAAVNEVMGGMLGAGGRALSHAVPPTALPAKNGMPPEVLEQMRSFGANPMRSQIDPTTLASRLSAGPLANLGKPEQVEQFTKALLKEAGSTETRITDKVLEKRDAEITKELSKIFQGQAARVGSAEKKQLMDAIAQNPAIADVMGNSRTLASIHQALTDAKSNTYPKFKLEDIQRAWDEVGKSAGRTPEGQQVRALLEGIMEKNMGPEGVEALQKLLHQRNTLRDIEKVWGGGVGQSSGALAGTLSPAELQAQGDKLLNKTKVGEAAGLVKALDLHEPHPNPIPTNTGTMLKMINPTVWAAEVPGANILNKTMVNSPEWAKSVAEILRKSTSIGPRELREQFPE